MKKTGEISRRAIVRLGLTAVPIAMTSKYWSLNVGRHLQSATYEEPLRLAGASASLATAAPMTRPTGAGIYAIEDLGISGWGNIPGAGGLAKALAKVATLTAAPDGTRTLTLPEHVFSLNGFSQSANYLGLLVPASVGIVGSGRGTIIEVVQDSMTQAQSDSWERYGLAYGNVNLMHIMLTMNAPAGTTYAQFHLRGQRQKVGGVGRDHYYNGWKLQGATNPVTVSDVLISGVPGYLNSPPGETFGMNLLGCNRTKLNRVEVDGRNYLTGVKQGACGIGTNNSSNMEMRDCYTHHMGYSHGLALWQSQNLTTWNFRSEYNGTLGSGGTVGAGLNHEKTFNTLHYSPMLGFNSMTEIRYYGGGVAPNAGSTDGHKLHNAVVTDSGQLGIWIEEAQRNGSGEISYINCPPPVFTYYNGPVPTTPGVTTAVAVATDNLARTAQLTWSAPACDGYSPVTAYSVTRDGTDASGNGPTTVSVAGTARALGFDNLKRGSTYTFTVRAINAKGSGPTATAMGAMAVVPQGSPASVKATKSVANRTATLSWLPPSDDGGSANTGYRVARDGTDASGYGVWGTNLSSSSRSQTFTNLRVGSTYRLSVQTFSAAGTGRETSVVVVMT